MLLIQKPALYESATMTDDVLVVPPDEYVSCQEFRALQVSCSEALLSVRYPLTSIQCSNGFVYALHMSD